MYLGIEIGGTKLQMAIGNADGSLPHVWRETVNLQYGAAGIRDQLQRGFHDILKIANVNKSVLSAVGVGFGGPVDDATSHIIKSHQIEGWDDFPLAQWLTDQFGLPAVVGNDADVAGLGEAIFGAGQNLSPVFYITIGSGIGGGLIVDGEIYRGAGRGAAEIGHLRFPIVNHMENIVGYRTVESICSGWGIVDRAKSMFESNPESLLWSEVYEEITPHEIADAASRGDSMCMNMMRLTLGVLADAICHVVALLCPKRIVIGGGVSLLGEQAFFEPLRQAVRKRVFEPFADCFDIVPAALGEQVVLHGAIALAKHAHGNGTF